MWTRGREYQDNPWKNFCFTVPKIFVGEPLLFHYFRVSKKFMLERVMSRFSIFCRTFFVSQCRKYSQVNPSVLCFRKFPVVEILWVRGGGVYQDIPWKNFCFTVQKKFVG